MSKTVGKKERAQASALKIADKLSRLLKEKDSERQWTKDAGVSPSFFSNLRGTPTKPPSDPSVDVLRQVLSAREMTLAEFFVDEARGRVEKATRESSVDQTGHAFYEQPKAASVARASQKKA